MPKTAPLLRPHWTKISRNAFREEYGRLGSVQDLAFFWGVNVSQLNHYAYYIDKRSAYRNFTIPRRNGQRRLIEAPNPTLEHLQRLLYESLAKVYGPSRCVHGFLRGRSIVTNAQKHLNSRFVLNVDLEDFFPSITRQRIYGRLVVGALSFPEQGGSLNCRIGNELLWAITSGKVRLHQ